ncbi:hypothetical protein BP6252_09965 [Coleophoma cylindrospora]|uniref:Uncharacterized protein n=1 Tax=Coleophoma cylindrospora TaxID=1849047 RepID=A0A3D8QXB5_9HELO|nr:hypothetical protein BP6252_09965 [Coleophoma cylindrospora]
MHRYHAGETSDGQQKPGESGQTGFVGLKEEPGRSSTPSTSAVLTTGPPVTMKGRATREAGVRPRCAQLSQPSIKALETAWGFAPVSMSRTASLGREGCDTKAEFEAVAGKAAGCMHSQVIEAYGWLTIGWKDHCFGWKKAALSRIHPSVEVGDSELVWAQRGGYRGKLSRRRGTITSSSKDSPPSAHARSDSDVPELCFSDSGFPFRTPTESRSSCTYLHAWRQQQQHRSLALSRVLGHICSYGQCVSPQLGKQARVAS